MLLALALACAAGVVLGTYAEVSLARVRAAAAPARRSRPGRPGARA
jgi:hypothetical protein